MTNITPISSLDFDDIKSDLKLFLTQQSEFTDYDFEGSSISVLIDLLAYTTHYMSLQANMSINEMFLETASLRNSVVNKAKELNYIPRSKTSSQAVLNVSIDDASAPNKITIPKGTQFSSIKDDITYLFVTTFDQTLKNISGITYNGDIVVQEGEYVESSFTVSNVVNGLIKDRFIIQDTNIDTRFMQLSIADVENGIYINWTLNDDVTKVDEDSAVFYLQESDYLKYEVYFGMNKIGLSPILNNHIKINYIVSSGIDANLINNYALVDNIIDPITSTLYNVANIAFSVVSKSFGGKDRESIEEIKLLAPRYFETQGRAVTENDYKSLVTKHFAFVETLSVWGGETNSPPDYGKVFIAIKPNYGDTIAPSTREVIKDKLKEFNVVGIDPVIVDPNFVKINVEGIINWNSVSTTTSKASLATLVQTQLDNKIDLLSKNFDNVIYFSVISSFIDEISPSIVANLTYLTLSQHIRVLTSSNITYKLYFVNELVEGYFESTWVDVVNRVITLKVNDLDNTKIDKFQDGILAASNVGTIDYKNGIVSLHDFTANTVVNQQLEIKVRPTKQNIKSEKTSLLIAGDMTNITYEDVSRAI